MRRRVAAGTVLVAAVVTIGGPGIAGASADPGHGNSRGDRGHHGQGRGDSDRGGDRGHGRSDHHRGRHDGRGGESSDNDRFQRGEDDSGSGSADANDSTSSFTSSGTTASRSVTVASEAPSVQSVDAADTPTVAATGTPEPVVAAGGGGGGGAAAAETPIERPTVVVGDGRTPGLLSSGPAGADTRDTTPTQATEAAVAPAVPAAPVVTAPAPPPAIPDPEAPFPWVASEIWSPIGPGDAGNALFGLAGLILIPLAGVWLGYRQALAARAAANLADR